MSLTGKTAFVTGGSRGIGAAIVLRLAEAGSDVAFTYNASAEAAETVRSAVAATGRQALAIKADNTSASDLNSAIEQAASYFGEIDILVNNAGIFKTASIEDMTLEVFDETMAVHLRAAFVAVKAVLPHMPDGGRIVSIGSNLAFRAGFPGLTAYSASKAAISGFTRALARDLGPRGITVTAIHPGSTNTEMNPANGPAADMQRAVSATNRYGEPQEIANLVAFVASDAARSVTGADMMIDNGANA